VVTISSGHNSVAKANRKEFFNETAENWDQQSPEENVKEFLKMVLPRFGIKSGQRVLDVGTGTGVLIPSLVQAVGPTGLVVAVDFAEKMVEECRRKYFGFPNVKVELQDAEELNFPRDYFDVVTCFGLFPHIENKQKALNSMFQVLKPKGRIVIAHALGSQEIREIHSTASEVIAEDVMPSEKEMRELFDNAGFVVDSIIDQPGCYLLMATKKDAD